MLSVTTRISEDGKVVVILLVLAVLTLMSYWQIQNHDFINFDDPQYVTDNGHIRYGLTKEGISWAFRSGYAGNWHPLTWISHMADVDLFGLNPGAHHLSNLFLHIANTLLLFLVLKEMTGRVLRSGFVAALFAIHPLHIESVAWVAERKDVLCAFFWMLTMGSYALYARKSGLKLYMMTLLFFVLGLMSKPMIVTLPFVFLLLDYWPLGRINSVSPTKEGNRMQSFKSVLIEKIPFLCLSAVSAVITYTVQQQAGAVQSWQMVSWMVRFANISISYVVYLWKTLWPAHLAVYYPYPNVIVLWKAVLAALLLISVTVIVLRKSLKYPFLGVGWFWYLGTLVPVIGIIQVGDQAMADRYTYLPLIGIFIILSWGGDALAEKYGVSKRDTLATCLIIIAILALLTFKQASHWKSSITLFEQAVSNTKDNYIAHCKLGMAYGGTDREKARYNLEKTVAIAPGMTEAYCWLALLQSSWGENDAAEVLLNDILRRAPQNQLAHHYMGNVLQKKGDTEGAIRHYLVSLSFNSSDPETLNGLGAALISRKKYKEAKEYLTRALAEKPAYPDALSNMGILLARTGNADQAASYFNRALRLSPKNAAYHNNLGKLLLDQNKIDEAIAHFHKALEIEPGLNDAKQNLYRTTAMQRKNGQ